MKILISGATGMVGSALLGVPQQRRAHAGPLNRASGATDGAWDPDRGLARRTSSRASTPSFISRARTSQAGGGTRPARNASARAACATLNCSVKRWPS